MSEAIYQQVEDAIRRRLHLLCDDRRTPMGGPDWDHPVGIEWGMIMLMRSDCGREAFAITPEEWARRAEGGLWRMVGGWSFVLASDPAADDIAFAHRSPSAAGRQLARLRAENARLRERLGEE